MDIPTEARLQTQFLVTGVSPCYFTWQRKNPSPRLSVETAQLYLYVGEQFLPLQMQIIFCPSDRKESIKSTQIIILCHISMGYFSLVSYFFV